MTYKFIDSLFPTEDEMKLYLSHPFPFNLSLVKERLDKKLEEDPNYEVFLPLHYRKIDKRLKTKDALKLVNPSYVFISNRGNIISNSVVKTFRPVPLSVHPGGYVIFRVAINGKNNTLSLHRALACSFIPLRDDLLAQGLHPKDLEVNHLNGDKLDYSPGNLEWETREGNESHAHATGLKKSGKDHPQTKPVKLEIVKGPFSGQRFVLFGVKSIEAHGFDQGGVSNAVAGRFITYAKCKWTLANPEEIEILPHQIPQDVLVTLKYTYALKAA